MNNVTLVSHPVIDSSMTVLRNKKTGTDEFRRHADIVCKILLAEALKNLQLEDKKIETPLESFTGKEIKGSVVVVPILRAGLAMLSAAYQLMPSASVGFIGLVRDEKTAIADKYYEKLPEIHSDDQVLVVDPMLATGGSMDEALNIVKKAGAKKILAVTTICSPEGIKRINDTHPDIEIITAVVDKGLDSRAYIVPGLGDFGDRYFGTEQLAG